MKITINAKQQKDVVKIKFSEEIAQTRFVINEGQEILEIKVAETSKVNRRKWINLVRGIVREAKKNHIKNIEIDWNELTKFENLGEELGQLFAENVEMANYEFRKYKKKPKDGWSDVESINLLTDNSDLQNEIDKGVIVAKEVNFCRELANTPGIDLTPEILVEEVREAIKDTKIEMNVLNKSEMESSNMNGILAVGGGSQYEPKFIILEYKGDSKSESKTVLVGKGVTFDTGGIDTKPHPRGLNMMMDMSGGAAVISSIIATEKLGLKKNVVALIPAVENMPSGSSFRPSDIIRMMDGTAVEVRHTDAEGRLILADALVYARKYNPDLVIDVATLTGASVNALGLRASAIFTNDDDLAKRTEELSEKSGDYVWRLPLWEEYESDIKGVFGEIANLNTKVKTPAGAAITAATFLKHFAKDCKSWMHIDIAPRTMAVYDENLSEGAAGAPVRLLVKLLIE